jgi:hypothetical protein
MKLNHGMPAVLAAYPNVERIVLEDSAQLGDALLKAA